MKIVKDNGSIMMILKEGETSYNELKYNDCDASFEKHVPQYDRNNEEVTIYVNHVMEEDHYIEWIMVDYDDEQIIKHFHPGDEAKVVVPFRKGMKAYSYCNKHSLWANTEIK